MGVHKINTPRDQTIHLGKAVVKLTWAHTAGARLSGHFDKMQAFIDSEVLRLDAPLMPIKTGNMIQSGIRGTKIGSGEVVYNAVYSANQYYNTKDSRPYDHRRGAHWFERMKAAHLDDIKRGAERI